MINLDLKLHLCDWLPIVKHFSVHYSFTPHKKPEQAFPILGEKIELRVEATGPTLYESKWRNLGFESRSYRLRLLLSIFKDKSLKTVLPVRNSVFVKD